MEDQTRVIGDGLTVIKVEVGQQVKVYRGRKDYRDGNVVKVGRIWTTVRMGDYGQEYRFRMDNQTDGSGYGNPARFWTMDQWRARERGIEESAYLREQGIDLRYGSPWIERQSELVALLRSTEGGSNVLG